MRLLAELRPAWFLGENVPGLLSVTDGEDFGIVLQDVADLGMGFAYRVLDAQFFGVPQRRRRVFIVGRAGDDRRPVEVLLEPKGGGGNPPASGPPGQGVAATPTRGPSGAGVSAPGRRQEDDVNIVPTITARYGKGVPSDADDAIIVGTLTSHNGGPDDNMAQAGHLVRAFQKVIRSGERDADGNLPPEVWAERDVAATLNLNDLASAKASVTANREPSAWSAEKSHSNMSRMASTRF